VATGLPRKGEGFSNGLSGSARKTVDAVDRQRGDSRRMHHRAARYPRSRETGDCSARPLSNSCPDSAANTTTVAGAEAPKHTDPDAGSGSDAIPPLCRDRAQTGASPPADYADNNGTTGNRRCASLLARDRTKANSRPGAYRSLCAKQRTACGDHARRSPNTGRRL